MLSAIGAVAQILGGALIGAFIVFAEVAVGAVTMAVNVIASIITGLIGIIAGVVEAVTGVLAGDWSAAWDGASNAVSAAFNAMAGIASAVGGAIVGTIQNIVSAVRSAASAISGLGSGGGGGEEVEVDSNARGGIYRKGAFLTTFAEESDEAAIPLDGSARAIGLWRMAGRILGVGGDKDENVGYQAAPSYARTVNQIRPQAPKAVTRTAVEEYRPAEPPPVEAIRESGQRTIIRPNEERERGGTGTIEPPPINITLNFYGQEEPHRVRQAVLDAGRKVQKSFAEQMEAYKRERGRLAFE